MSGSMGRRGGRPSNGGGLRVGDTVRARVSGNPYCKDEVVGEVISVGLNTARVRVDVGHERIVYHDWCVVIGHDTENF